MKGGLVDVVVDLVTCAEGAVWVEKVAHAINADHAIAASRRVVAGYVGVCKHTGALMPWVIRD